jgi:hypothetical protein
MWTTAQAGEEGVISEKSKLTLTGRVHAQFHTTSVKDATPASTFFVRRARIKAAYNAGNLKGVVQYEMGEGSPNLKDGYVDLEVSDGFKIKMGQFKKPFSLWELTSTTKLLVIERANKIMETANSYSTNAVIIKDGFYAGRDIGVQLHGKSGKVGYAFGIFNGNGNNKKSDDDNGKTFGGRMVVAAMDDVSIGGAFSNVMINDYETIAEGDTVGTLADENFQAFEFDIEYGNYKVKEAGPWILAEVLMGKNPAFHSTDVNFVGFMGAFAYNVLTPNSSLVHSVRPAVRFDWSKRNTDDDDSQTILLTPGMDIFFDTNNRLAINLDVNMPNADDADTEFAIRAQFQMLI